MRQHVHYLQVLSSGGEQRDGIKIELPRSGITDQESIRSLKGAFTSARKILSLSAFHIYIDLGLAVLITKSRQRQVLTRTSPMEHGT